MPFGPSPGVSSELAEWPSFPENPGPDPDDPRVSKTSDSVSTPASKTIAARALGRALVIISPLPTGARCLPVSLTSRTSPCAARLRLPWPSERGPLCVRFRPSPLSSFWLRAPCRPSYRRADRARRRADPYLPLECESARAWTRRQRYQILYMPAYIILRGRGGSVTAPAGRR